MLASPILIRILLSELVFMGTWWTPVDVKLYVDPDQYKLAGKVSGLLLMNHSYEIDWLIGWIFCDAIGVLGNCKAYAKKVIQYIPIVGWSWKFANYIFLERSFEKDKLSIGQQIREAYDYPDPVWVNTSIMLCLERRGLTRTNHFYF